MYKYTRTEYCATAPSLGGGTGIATTTCFSRSPKLATTMQGTVIRDERGDCAVPQLIFVSLERDGKTLFEGWID